MPYELTISLRYLRAKRKQVFVSAITFISIMGIFLGVAALIIVLAVMNGFETDLRKKILGINAHIVLMEYGGFLRDFRTIEKKIEGVEGIVAATPFVYTQAMIKKGDLVSGVVLRGLSLPSATKVLDLGKIKEGSLESLSREKRRLILQKGEKEEELSLPGLIVGKELAKNLGISLYDKVYLLSPLGVSTPVGIIPRLKKFLVVAIFDSGFFEYDASLAFTELKDAQEFLDLGELITGLEIKVQDIYKADVIAKNLERKLGFPYWVRHWMEMNKNLFAALRLEKRVMFIILSLIVLVAVFNIIVTLIMIVMEKNRDIAILKSMGATSRNILKIFVYQGLIIGITGTLLGTIFGLAVAYNLEEIAQFIERLFGFKIMPGDVYYLSKLPSQVNYLDVTMIVVITLMISLLATIYPSLRASRLEPAEALRYD